MVLLSILFLLSFGAVDAQRPGDDLLSFLTLPEIRALTFNVTYHDREAVSPGYWFVAPYSTIDPEAPTKKWEPCQVGPYIFDEDGTLIWAGSCMFRNRNIFDFKAVDNIDDKYHLSFVLQHAYHDDGTDKGLGYVLDDSYEPEAAVPVLNDLTAFNMHEFNILDGGKTALACSYRAQNMDLSSLGRPEEFGWAQTGGFVELDTATGEVLFEWDSRDYVPLSDSNHVNPWDPAMGDPGWDYIHVNSIDKNSNGDYLLSARFTSTLYLISGQDGHIIWKLGGQHSDFVQDFTFSMQHHARFVESNGTHHLISFLNNASDEISQQEDVSSALYVQLDTTASPMTARVVKRYNRPDGNLTRLRGNVQTLPNGNVFVGWSERGYQSEFSPDGKVLMEARFASPRFSTYRSYKFPFVGRPATPPDVVASVYGTNDDDLTTIFHVSWNGATDVATWRFYAQASENHARISVGNTTKTGFETMYIADGYLDWISVEAVDKDGNLLGTSTVQRSAIPTNWQAAGFSGSAPTPDDPSILFGVTEVVADEHHPTQEEIEYSNAKEAARAVYKAYEVIRGIGGLLIFILIFCSVGGILAGMWWMLRRSRTRPYLEVPEEERIAIEEVRMPS